jgi:hypothetical protein
MITAVASKSSPAAPVSNVDLERAPCTIAFISRTRSPSDSPSDSHSTDLQALFRWCWPAVVGGGLPPPTALPIPSQLRRD